MPKQDFGYPPSGRADGEVALGEPEVFAAALRDSHHGPEIESGPLAPSDQLARDIAEIERASAALRKAEPALETWTDAPAGTSGDDAPPGGLRKPRPVWLLVGLLWLSTALVTAGAVAAIARLAAS